MATIEDSMMFLTGLVQTEEQRLAFRTGYDAADDPRFRAHFSGSMNSKFKGGLSVILEDLPEHSWTNERELPRGNGTVLVYDPSFVLGALVRGLEVQANEQAPTSDIEV